MIKTVLVTGAAKRLGRAIALDLASIGWNVAIHYHGSAEEAESAADAVRALGVKAATLKANLSREEETTSLIGRAAAELGPLTALVNSASIFENDDWQSASRASWDAHMETNLRAPFVLSQAFARQYSPPPRSRPSIPRPASHCARCARRSSAGRWRSGR